MVAVRILGAKDAAVPDDTVGDVVEVDGVLLDHPAEGAVLHQGRCPENVQVLVTVPRGKRAAPHGHCTAIAHQTLDVTVECAVFHRDVGVACGQRAREMGMGEPEFLLLQGEQVPVRLSRPIDKCLIILTAVPDEHRFAHVVQQTGDERLLDVGGIEFEADQPGADGGPHRVLPQLDG